MSDAALIVVIITISVIIANVTTTTVMSNTNITLFITPKIRIFGLLLPTMDKITIMIIIPMLIRQ